MDVRRYIISNPTMVKNADGIVEAYKPGEHVMVMAADYDAVSKERSAIMQSLECVIEKAEEFRKEREALRARLAEAERSDAIHLEALATSEALRVREQREAFVAGVKWGCNPRNADESFVVESARRYPDA